MDQSRFINTYIDVIINSLQEQMKTILQLQTQIKIHEFVVGEKDQTIQSLNNQIEQMRIESETNIRNLNATIEHIQTEKNNTVQSLNASLNAQIVQNQNDREWKTRHDAMEEQYNASMKKLSHMDTLLKQISDMKRIITEKDAVITSLQNPKKSKKTTINNKQKEVAEEPKPPTDDF